MKCKRSLAVAALLLANCSLAFTQVKAPPRAPLPILQNSNVLRMYQDGMKQDVIIAKIVTSRCNFDTFPPALRELRMRGVPDTVLMAMVKVPHGPPAMVAVDKAGSSPKTARLRIPASTVVEVEAAYPVSSADVDKGSLITFLVSRQVFVNDVPVIARGAVARARVLKSKPAGAWGRAGTLVWEMEDVVAVDGTRVPIRLSDQIKGANRTTAVAAAAIVTGAIIFPYTSPVALVWWLKKGDDAVLHGSQKFTAIVSNNTQVTGLLPEKKRVIYHLVGRLNPARSANGRGLASFNNSFRPTPIRQR